MRVSPFGHLRIKAYVRLPGAFRSLSRPSSAPSAKASALRSSSLDQSVSFDLFVLRFLAFYARTLLRSFPYVRRSFPAALIFCYLNDNASIDVLPQLLTSAASYSSCAQTSALKPEVHALQDYRICGFQGASGLACPSPSVLRRSNTSFFVLAATCSPMPSPA